MRLSSYKYHTRTRHISTGIPMRFDNVFPPAPRKEIIVVRKDGRLYHDTRDMIDRPKPADVTKPTLFPISKERQ